MTASSDSDPDSAPGPGPGPSDAPAGRPAYLGQNQYGKAETRVVRVVRDGATHHVRDLNVSVALSGDMDEVHYSGDNAKVLPTDTAKNTVFAFAREYGTASPEAFAVHLARHFVTSQEAIHRARIRIEEYAWERVLPDGDGDGDDEAPDRPRHSFVRAGRETRTTEVAFDGRAWRVISGLKDLVVMNTTDSQFRGFTKDRYTTLRETGDRVLATEVTARWRYGWTAGERPAPDWDASYERIRGHLLAAFAGTYSLSLQQTLYAMGARVVEHRPEVEEVRLSLPNKHHFLVDLEPFGLNNDNEVYFAADRPYGLIEGTVLRAGAEAGIPVTD
ncbi:factor-independent urate hydroxylase [Streptomyces sp. HPF1205]|uniref:factor-independent urate hydroxylase n=1 Tax=Streptomyces sp. HPF1205 TaxID=2873262 RepID=UPI001CECE9C9|nr:urate oxidase [Streptomyces sp. HPF1205]